MNYCCNFKKPFSLISKFDEIIIKYDEKNTHFIEFINEHPQKKITVFIDDKTEKIFIKNKELDKINNLNITIKVAESCSQIFYQALKEHGIRFYLDQYARDWEDIYYLLSLGVSEIYISEALGFDLERISNFLHQKDVQIRIFPNVAQEKREKIIPNIKTFFIRPEGILEYEPYIDTIEFWGDKPEVFYDIYKNDKHWYGDLSEIISDLEPGLDSRYIIPLFDQRRIKCNRKCLLGEKCFLCDEILKCSKTLQKAGLLINIKEENKDG